MVANNWDQRILYIVIIIILYVCVLSLHPPLELPYSSGGFGQGDGFHYINIYSLLQCHIYKWFTKDGGAVGTLKIVSYCIGTNHKNPLIWVNIGGGTKI